MLTFSNFPVGNTPNTFMYTNCKSPALLEVFFQCIYSGRFCMCKHIYILGILMRESISHSPMYLFYNNLFFNYTHTIVAILT